MRKQFYCMHLINYENDTLSLGGGGSGPISEKIDEYSDKGAVNGGAIGGLIGGIAGVVEVASGRPMVIGIPGARWAGWCDSADFVKLTTTVGAIVGVGVGEVVGGAIGAGVGTVDALRHSGSGGSRSGGPARRF